MDVSLLVLLLQKTEKKILAWVDPILRWKPLVILSRLTYCVYISHGIIQLYTAGSIRGPIYASVFNVVSFVCMIICICCCRIDLQAYETASDILLAYILAFVLTMLYESPIIAMERVLLKRKGMVWYSFGSFFMVYFVVTVPASDTKVQKVENGSSVEMQ